MLTLSTMWIWASKSLQANAIAGNITVDEFFAQYEQLKAQGLQEVIDQGAAAYEAMNK